MLRKLLILAALMPATAVHALSGWVSGGGELIRDARNPWFLANVKDINYCIEIDEANFGQTRAVATDLTRRAIENWKLEFKNALPSWSQVDWGIASQTFHETACDDNTDIRFQFGVLTGDQIKQLEDPTHYAGISVRTDYDRVHMRGKGFVYISPSRGPLKFVSENIVEEPWALSNGGLLYHVLLHELGHIFGLPHTASPGALMDERSVEWSLNPDRAQGEALYWSHFPKPRIFRYEVSDYGMLEICSSTSTSPHHVAQPSPEEFFGLPPNIQCLAAGMKKDKYVISIRRGTDQDSVEWGEATLTKNESPFDQTPAFYIWMPPEQVVFKPQQTAGLLAAGPLRQSMTTFKGTYKTLDKKVKREIVIFAIPDTSERVTGVMNGSILSNVWRGE